MLFVFAAVQLALVNQTQRSEREWKILTLADIVFVMENPRLSSIACTSGRIASA